MMTSSAPLQPPALPPAPATADSAVPSLIMRLVQHHVQSATPAPGAKAGPPSPRAPDETHVSSLYHYAVRMLGSRLPTNPLANEHPAMVADEILHEWCSNAALDRLSTLLTRALSSSSLQRPSAALLLLRQMMQSRDSPSGPSGDAPETTPAAERAAAPPDTLFGLASMLKTPHPATAFHPSPPASSLGTDSSRGPGTALAALVAPNGRTAPPARPAAEAAVAALEHELVRDLTFVFQGSNGTHFCFDAGLGMYAVSSELHVSPPTCELLVRLSELGTLYRPVRTFVEAHMTGDGGQMRGHVGQAFVAAIQDELGEYYRTIAALEARLTGNTGDPVTLKRLWLWAQEPIQRMRMMNVLVKLAAGQQGGTLVSMIHTYTNHGDPFVRGFNESLIARLSVPYFGIMARWLSHGELDDPFDEFFVQEDTSVPPEALWQSRFSVRAPMLASFLNKTTAKRIFLVGKSLNLIRHCCRADGVDAWLDEFAARFAPELARLRYSDNSLPLESLVERMYVHVSQKVLELVFVTYGLQRHVTALRQFVLLHQGDFIQNLMDALHSELDKPPDCLFRHDLMSTVDGALAASSARSFDGDTLRRLDVRLLDPKPGDSGWEVFALEYHIGPPLDTVFSPPVRQQYLKLFHFLWRIKRVEYVLSRAWAERTRLARRLAAYSPVVRAMLRRSQLVCASMVHFVGQLQAYMQFDVLDAAWREFGRFLERRDGDLDTLIAGHNRYLNSITARALLTPAGAATPSVSFFHRMLALFQNILDYHACLAALLEHCHGALRDRGRVASESYRAALDAKFGLSHLGASNSSTPAGDVALEPIRAAAEKAAEAFETGFRAFVQQLGVSGDPQLVHLHLRFDFNGQFPRG